MAVFEEVVAVALVERVPRARRPALVFRSHRGPQQLALDARPEVWATQKTSLHVVLSEFVSCLHGYNCLLQICSEGFFALILVECGETEEKRAKSASVAW